MKRARLLALTILAAAIAGGQTSLLALNVVGFANISFSAGDNWIGNPLSNTPNDLNTVIPTAPDGTTISLWNPILNVYTPDSIFSGGSWTSDLTLNPGTGALLETPNAFTNTWVGNVLDFTGANFDGSNFHEPSPFSGPSGRYLLSSKAPFSLSGHVFDASLSEYSVFEAIIGRAPHTGESVTTLDPLTQTFKTTTFSGGAWNNGDPLLPLGEAAMFNIGPVPEPGSVALFLLGSAAYCVLRRKSRRS